MFFREPKYLSLYWTTFDVNSFGLNWTNEILTTWVLIFVFFFRPHSIATIVLEFSSFLDVKSNDLHDHFSGLLSPKFSSFPKFFPGSLSVYSISTKIAGSISSLEGELPWLLG